MRAWQILGSCSQTGMPTIRVPPKRVFMTTGMSRPGSETSSACAFSTAARTRDHASAENGFPSPTSLSAAEDTSSSSV